jgi:hypothetical protein
MLNDTRLRQALTLTADASALLSELVDELPDDRDRNLLAGAIQFLSSANGLAAKVEGCGRYSCLGSLCVRPRGHDDPHRSEYGAEWTGESDAASARTIATSMKGRCD